MLTPWYLNALPLRVFFRYPNSPSLMRIFLLKRAMAGAHLMEKGKSFFIWDLLTVAQLVRPELFTTEDIECDVIVAGASQGRIVRTGGLNKAIHSPTLLKFEYW